MGFYCLLSNRKRRMINCFLTNSCNCSFFSFFLHPNDNRVSTFDHLALSLLSLSISICLDQFGRNNLINLLFGLSRQREWMFHLMKYGLSRCVCASSGARSRLIIAPQCNELCALRLSATIYLCSDIVDEKIGRRNINGKCPLSEFHRHWQATKWHAHFIRSFFTWVALLSMLFALSASLLLTGIRPPHDGRARTSELMGMSLLVFFSPCNLFLIQWHRIGHELD